MGHHCFYITHIAIGVLYMQNYNNVISYLQAVAPIPVKQEVTKMLLSGCE